MISLRKIRKLFRFSAVRPGGRTLRGVVNKMINDNFTEIQFMDIVGRGKASPFLC